MTTNIIKSEESYFSKKSIVEFLGNYGEPGTKDYEFAAALTLCHRCEQESGKECWVGFRIRRDHQKLLPTVGSQKTIGLAEVVSFLRGGIDEDSYVDFSVANLADMRKARGMKFQVKRFGIGRDKKDTDELIAYLTKLSSKYEKSRTKLLLCLDDFVSVDFSELYTKVDFEGLPFSGVMFFWLSNGSVYIRDVFPQGGTVVYPAIDLFR